MHHETFMAWPGLAWLSLRHIPWLRPLEGDEADDVSQAGVESGPETSWPMMSSRRRSRLPTFVAEEDSSKGE